MITRVRRHWRVVVAWIIALAVICALASILDPQDWAQP